MTLFGLDVTTGLKNIGRVKKMKTIKDLFALCESLKYSQGFYGRLLEQLNALTDEDYAIFDKTIQDANLETDLDLILWLEE